ncbi:MAG: sigma-70 family RNA polymerase sigma factor [Verrucomicrobiales bacterium]|nr:sigma-70 family RNA polymerase sigma factor [Verrucomicrobiales bacterium]
MASSPGSSSTADLVRQALQDYESILIGYTANLLGGDVERARDVVQDAFLKLCQADPDRVRHGLRSWLFTVCRNRAFDVLRKDQRLDFADWQDLDRQDESSLHPADQADSTHLSELAWALVEQLSPNQQEVIRLKFQHDLPYQEIAEITGLSVGNVGFLLHTALKKLRQRLQRQLKPAPPLPAP